jgi:hypothetical protein
VRGSKMKIFLYRGLDFFHFRNCSDPILEKKRKDAKAKKKDEQV